MYTIYLAPAKWKLRERPIQTNKQTNKLVENNTIIVFQKRKKQLRLEHPKSGDDHPQRQQSDRHHRPRPVRLRIVQAAITFSWQANNGAIIAGQGTNSVDVIWNQASSGKLTINRSNGFCSATDTLNIITTFNFSEISNKFNIYPNPTKGLIIIENSNNIIAFKLTDSSGKEVLISKTEGQIDISNLPTGSYQLILSTKEGTTTHAIQKI